MDERLTTDSGRRRVRLALLATLGVALLVGVVLGALYVRGGGPLPFVRQQRGTLQKSGPEETVLRTLRLAGFERVAVGESAGTVVVRVEVPEMASAADAELSWLTSVAAATAAYPSAQRYVVQLFAAGSPILEVRVPGSAAREAVDGDDAAALKKAAEFVYLTEGVE